MRIDAASVLIGMGYVSDRDFIATHDGTNGVNIDWRAQSPIPTEAEIDAAALSVAKAQRIAAIKATRDRVKIEGVTVGEHRFHSDPDSRTQQLGLVIMGAAVPPVQWKTMGGAFVTMTQTLAGQIFQGTAARDMAVFGHAEALIAAVNASDDPDSIDIEAGWPA